MAKYDPLRAKLRNNGSPTVTLTFEEIAFLVGDLPKSAWDHQAWWANEKSGRHVHARAWMDAGYRVDSADQSRGVVRFVKGH